MTERLPLEFCPLCSRADATATHTTSVAKDMDMSLTLNVPDRLCGRCLIALSDAALSAAMLKYAAMRGVRA